MSLALACRAILFDADGVLVDSDAAVLRSWTRWARQWELDPDAVAAVVHGRRSADTVAVLIDPAAQDQALTDIDRYEVEDAAGVTPIPGAPALTAALPRNRWAVVTSGRRELATTRLTAAGLPLPGVLVCAEDVPAGKPDPAGYRQAAAALGFPVTACVVLEDSASGVAAGLAAGATVVGVGERALETAAAVVVRDLTGLTFDGAALHLPTAALLRAPEVTTSSPEGPPVPTSDPTGLPLEEKVRLLSGQDFWSVPAVGGLPSVVLTDGPHGVRRQVAGFDRIGLLESAPATCFPPAVAVGSSWDPQVAERIGAAVGAEARALGVHVVLGPGVNIKRSPLCGRNFEYYSEDPLLAGVLGAAHVRGQQGQGVGASVKHFAANNQETERMQISVAVDERTLREIYLPAFERVVTESRPATVMCAYNRVNGIYASQHRKLLTEILRDEWGFRGAVVSDWGAVDDRVAALAAGLDLQMPGDRGAGNARVVAAVRAGTLDEAVVDTSARRVAALAELVAEPTEGFDAEGFDAEGFDAEAHHAVARELAADCAVLLKNDGDVLPLAGTARIAVVGEFARTPRFQGGGSSHVNATRVDAALDAVRSLATGTVQFAPGFALDGAGDAAALRDEAVRVARDAEVAVVFAGLGDQEESEGFDRDTLDLPAAQVELIRAVAAASPRTVVVLSHGGVVSLEGWHDDVDAVLDGFLLGQAGGSAVADLLFGRANPSGHLAETIPLRLADTSSYLNFPGEQGVVRYGEGVMVGYRHFTTVGREVRYPFGHGLSYTTFATSDLRVEATGPDTATVTLTVTNTGTRAGKHVVQVYVATGAGPVRRPARELRAFTKLALEPGESREVAVRLDRRAFAYYDVREGGWVVAPGEYAVQLGASAADVVAEAALTLTGDDAVPPLTLDSGVAEWFTHPVVGPVLAERMREWRAGSPDRDGAEDSADSADPGLLQMVASMPMRRFVSDMGVAAPAGALEELLTLAERARSARNR